MARKYVPKTLKRSHLMTREQFNHFKSCVRKLKKRFCVCQLQSSRSTSGDYSTGLKVPDQKASKWTFIEPELLKSRMNRRDPCPVDRSVNQLTSTRWKKR